MWTKSAQSQVLSVLLRYTLYRMSVLLRYKLYRRSVLLRYTLYRMSVLLRYTLYSIETYSLYIYSYDYFCLYTSDLIWS